MPTPLYNQRVVDAAEAVSQQAQRDFFGLRGQGTVVGTAVAGAGKTQFVTQTAKRCRRERMRTAVAAPTNEQVFSLVHSIATNEPNRPVTFIPAKNVVLPERTRRLPNVTVRDRARDAGQDEVVVGTIDKFASAIHPFKGDPLRPFDSLIIDESYQADAGRYYALADIAPRHLLVGDGGQIQPFSTIEEARQWRGLPEDPLQNAVEVLRKNHPHTPVHRFPITRRLDSRGATLARCFYPPEHQFEPAVCDGVRSMRLMDAVGGNARRRAMDRALTLAARQGFAHLELPARQTLVADPETAQIIADLVHRLYERGPQLVCERNGNWHTLQHGRIAVAVSHNNQKAMLKLLLDTLGLQAVVVDNANKLQGLEFDVTLCWHPLAGLLEADEFHTEAGRMCVMATRHRHTCIVVGRRDDRKLVQGLPPATPSYPGAIEDQLLQGWAVHKAFFDVLEPYRTGMPA